MVLWKDNMLFWVLGHVISSSWNALTPHFNMMDSFGSFMSLSKCPQERMSLTTVARFLWGAQHQLAPYYIVRYLPLALLGLFYCTSSFMIRMLLGTCIAFSCPVHSKLWYLKKCLTHHRCSLNVFHCWKAGEEEEKKEWKMNYSHFSSIASGVLRFNLEGTLLNSLCHL